MYSTGEKSARKNSACGRMKSRWSWRRISAEGGDGRSELRRLHPENDRIRDRKPRHRQQAVDLRDPVRRGLRSAEPEAGALTTTTRPSTIRCRGRRATGSARSPSPAAPAPNSPTSPSAPRPAPNTSSRRPRRLRPRSSASWSSAAPRCRPAAPKRSHRRRRPPSSNRSTSPSIRKASACMRPGSGAKPSASPVPA